jgi:hypothetical protein
VARKELEYILDYILNKASEAEFEVIAKACERRARDIKVFESLGGEGPNAMAKRMAAELERGVGATMENVRATVRNLVADIVRKEAPDIGRAELEAILEEYAPQKQTPRGQSVSPIPPEALLSMIRSFVEYSRGSMPPSRQRELWESAPRWQEEYWAAFPSEIKALIKAFLEGRIDDEVFGKAVLSILGL